jgi:hypothetical protein
MVQRRHVAKTVKEGDVSMTVAKHCVSRRWIVPFLKSRIHYLAARRPAMIPPFQLTPDFLPAAQKVGACEIGLKARGGLLAFREHCGRVPQLIGEGNFQHVLRRALQDKVRSTA